MHVTAQVCRLQRRSACSARHSAGLHVTAQVCTLQRRSVRYSAGLYVTAQVCTLQRRQRWSACNARRSAGLPVMHVTAQVCVQCTLYVSQHIEVPVRQWWLYYNIVYMMYQQYVGTQPAISRWSRSSYSYTHLLYKRLFYSWNIQKRSFFYA